MVTILEGPDGGGKSTLARSLASKRGVTVHFGLLDNLFENYLQVTRFIDPVLCDRLHLSEQAYGPSVRGKDALPASQRRMLERVLLSKQAVVILCLPPVEVCLKAFNSRPETEYLQKEELLRAVYARYDTQLTTDLPTVSYDYTSNKVAELLEKVELARSPLNLGPGVGQFSQRSTLLVGDQLNQGDFPFVSLTGCSPWLADQLESAGVGEDQLYWVNAKTAADQPTDPDFIDKLQPAKVIALGEVAAGWCRDAGVVHVQVPHPQFWKRFHHRRPYPLLKELA